MESKPTWDDVMQYINCSLDTIVGEYWIGDNHGIRTLTVYLNTAKAGKSIPSLKIVDDLSFSWCWTHRMAESLYSEIGGRQTGFEVVRQLPVSENPVALTVETLATILYAVRNLRPNMFAGIMPNFH